MGASTFAALVSIDLTVSRCCGLIVGSSMYLWWYGDRDSGTGRWKKTRPSVLCELKDGYMGDDGIPRGEVIGSSLVEFG